MVPFSKGAEDVEVKIQHRATASAGWANSDAKLEESNRERAKVVSEDIHQGEPGASYDDCIVDFDIAFGIDRGLALSGGGVTVHSGIYRQEQFAGGGRFHFKNVHTNAYLSQTLDTLTKNLGDGEVWIIERDNADPENCYRIRNKFNGMYLSQDMRSLQQNAGAGEIWEIWSRIHRSRNRVIIYNLLNRENLTYQPGVLCDCVGPGEYWLLEETQ